MSNKIKSMIFLLLATVILSSSWAQSSEKLNNSEELYNILTELSKSTLPEAKVKAQNLAKYIETEAIKGNSRAQLLLGRFYQAGIFFEKDEIVAIDWYKKSAEQGLPDSQFNLAFALWRKNKLDSIYWFKKSANQGYSIAQFYLGQLYAVGNGVPKDYETAYFWLILAASSGNENAIKTRDYVEQDLSIQQRAAIQIEARKWRPDSFSTSNSITNDGSGIKANTESINANTTGSAIRVSSNLIVTNHHVVAGCTQIRANGIVVQVKNEDARADLALLISTNSGGFASIRSKRATVGEAIAVAGFPLRGMLSGFNITTGNLSSLSGIGGDSRLYQISAPVQPGNSGGPVLDSAGNLMGIVVSKLDAIKAATLTGDIPQNVNFAINLNVLRGFLDASGVEYEVSVNDKNIPTTAIAEKAKAFTMLIECWK